MLCDIFVRRHGGRETDEGGGACQGKRTRGSVAMVLLLANRGGEDRNGRAWARVPTCVACSAGFVSRERRRSCTSAAINT